MFGSGYKWSHQFSLLVPFNNSSNIIYWVPTMCQQLFQIFGYSRFCFCSHSFSLSLSLPTPALSASLSLVSSPCVFLFFSPIADFFSAAGKTAICGPWYKSFHLHYIKKSETLTLLGNHFWGLWGKEFDWATTGPFTGPEERDTISGWSGSHSRGHGAGLVQRWAALLEWSDWNGE